MPHVDILNDRIVVQAHWNEKELVKQVPGAAWDSNLKLWTLPVSWAACVQLRGIFGSTLTIGDALRAWAAHEKDTRIDWAYMLRERTKPLAGMAELDKLYPFQRAGVDFLKMAGSTLLADEMGTGKTIQLLELMDESMLPALVICPNSVKFNWQREADVWATWKVQTYVVNGSAAVRKKILEEAADDPGALVVVNFEAVRAHSRLAAYGSQRLSRCPDCGGSNPNVKESGCESHPKELNKIPFKTVIVDEAHRIKDPNAKQTRAAWACGAGKHVTKRFALTGTPIANDPSELWSIMHFVAPDEYPRKSAFIDRYCLLSWGTYGGLDVKGIRPDTRDEFYRVLDPRFRRMPKALVLQQLPPKVPVKRYVELTPKQLKAYRETESGLVTRLPDGSVMVAPNDLVAKTRLIQFSSATMKSTDEGFRMCDPSSKIDELLLLLEELGPKPVCVAADHRQLIDLAAARLAKHNISYGLITGAQSTWEREAALRDFQDGKLRVMLFTVKAGGTGLTMTAADTIIFLQRSWSMIDNKQAEDRIHRIGSEIHESITVVDLVARGTVEEEQIERLWEKSQRLEEIVRDRARLAAAGLSTAELDDEESKILNSDLGDPQ